MELKKGDFITFPGMTMTISGFVCKISDTEVSYIRDSLTRWVADRKMVERGEIITEQNFISRVQDNARASTFPVPSEEQIKSVLNLFTENYDVDSSEVHKLLNV